LRATTGFLLALVIGAASGLVLTWWSVAEGPRFGALHVGPWTAWPNLASQDADRYARASIARSGDLPLGPGEGLAFVARADSQGHRLDGACRYRIALINPPARWWTLALYDQGGRLAGNPAERFGFVSSQVVRDIKGGVAVSLGPEVRSGNWLPSPNGPMTLVLRLYDTPISSGLATADTIALPDIVPEGCP
jgi:hypothetical protein